MNGRAGSTSAAKSSKFGVGLVDRMTTATSSLLGRSRLRPRRRRRRRPSGRAASGGPAAPRSAEQAWIVLIREVGHARVGFAFEQRFDLAFRPFCRRWKELGAERRFARAQPLAAGDVAWLAGPIVGLRPFAVSVRSRGRLGRSRCAPALEIRPAIGTGASPFGLEIAWSGQPACRAFRPEVLAGRGLARSFPLSAARPDRRSSAAAPGRLVEPRRRPRNRARSPKSSGLGVGFDLGNQRSFPIDRAAPGRDRPGGG